MRTELLDGDRLAEAAATIGMLVTPDTPSALLGGFMRLWTELSYDESLAGKAVEATSRRLVARFRDLLDPLPNGPKVQWDDGIQGDVSYPAGYLEVVVAHDTGLPPSVLVQGYEHDSLVVCGPVTQDADGRTGRALLPMAGMVGDRAVVKVTVSAPGQYESLTDALALGAEALRAEGRADPDAADVWAKVAEHWIATGASHEGAQAFRRASTLPATLPMASASPPSPGDWRAPRTNQPGRSAGSASGWPGGPSRSVSASLSRGVENASSSNCEAWVGLRATARRNRPIS